MSNPSSHHDEPVPTSDRALARRKRYKKLAIVFGVVTVLAVIAGYQWHVKPKRATERYKAELIARGEKLSVAELLPPLTPDSSNAAPEFRKADANRNKGIIRNLLFTNTPSAMWMVAPGKAVTVWPAPVILGLSGKNLATNEWEDLVVALQPEMEAMSPLRVLLEKPRLDFNLDYSQGFDLMLPHLAPMKAMAQRHDAATLLELHRGNTSNAVEHTRVMLALAHAPRDEPLFITHLVRMAVAHIAFTTTWSLLQSPGLTDDQLAQLQGDWQRLEFLASMEQAMMLERAYAVVTIDRMRASSRDFNKIAPALSAGFGGGTPAPASDWVEQVGVIATEGWKKAQHKGRESAWRVAWSHVDELRSLKGNQVIIEAIRAAMTNGSYHDAISQGRDRLAELGFEKKSEPDDSFSFLGDDLGLASLFSSSVMSLVRGIDKSMQADAARDLTVAAIALQRHRLRHGRYPESLAELAPEFMTSAPRDPVDGKPLRYKLLSPDEFLLYSVGEDGVDDGGSVERVGASRSLNWRYGKDWVWPRVATQAEFDEFIRKETGGE